jgi:hypothetical protein
MFRRTKGANVRSLTPRANFTPGGKLSSGAFLLKGSVDEAQQWETEIVVKTKRTTTNQIESIQCVCFCVTVDCIRRFKQANKKQMKNPNIFP